MSESTELTPAVRAAVALRSTEREVILKGFADEAKEIISITNPDGYKQCHATRMTLKAERVAIEKQGKEAREAATVFSKAVIVEERRLIAIIEPEEERLEKIQKEWDDKIEAERQAKIDAEIKRIETIRAALKRIRDYPVSVFGKPSGNIKITLEELRITVIDEKSFEEFTAEAESLRISSIAAIEDLLTKAELHEAEQARIKSEREELAKLRAEQEERIRAEREAENKRRAEDDAKLQAERADLKKKKEEMLAALKEEALQQQEQRAAEDARIAAIRKSEQEQIDAEQARIKADREALEAEKAAVDKQRLNEEEKAIPASIPVAPIPLAEVVHAVLPTELARVLVVEPEMVTITKEEYDSLVRDSEILSALLATGVDSWDGYGMAMESLDQEAA